MVAHLGVHRGDEEDFDENDVFDFDDDLNTDEIEKRQSSGGTPGGTYKGMRRMKMVILNLIIF